MKNAVVTVENDVVNIIADEYSVSISLEQYSDIKFIGQGANGVVLLGKNILLNRLEAIKIYIPNKKGYVEKQQFIREVRKPAILNDKRYVTVYNAYIDTQSGACVCIMEYVDGQTLREWMNDNHCYLERLEICLDIIRAIEEYQSKGFFHGDIHTNNILIDKNNHIHIIDFGTSFWGGKQYTKEREAYFVYELVTKMLGEKFDENSMIFRSYDIAPNKKSRDDDVRNYHPYLVMLTLKAYLEYLDYMEQISIGNIEARHIAELCIRISKGIYFNIPIMIKEVTRLAEKCNMSGNDVAQIILDNWEVNIFPETIVSENQGRQIQEDILSVYFNMSYKYFEEWDWDQVKNYYFKHYIRNDHNVFDAYADLFRLSKLGNYEEFRNMNCDVEWNMFDNECKSILYSALVVSMNNNEFWLTFKIWQEINVLWARRIFNSME